MPVEIVGEPPVAEMIAVETENREASDAINDAALNDAVAAQEAALANAMADMAAQDALLIPLAQKGSNGGVATLDAVTGKLTHNQIPSEILVGGEPDVSLVSHIHDQAIPAAVWNVVHNLGFYPNVAAVDSGGSEVEGVVKYIDTNTVEIDFSVAFGGRAYLS